MTMLGECFCAHCREVRAALAEARADAERAVRERDRALALALRMAERCWGQAELLARRAEFKPEAK